MKHMIFYYTCLAYKRNNYDRDFNISEKYGWFKHFDLARFLLVWGFFFFSFSHFPFNSPVVLLSVSYVKFELPA